MTSPTTSNRKRQIATVLYSITDVLHWFAQFWFVAAAIVRLSQGKEMLGLLWFIIFLLSLIVDDMREIRRK